MGQYIRLDRLCPHTPWIYITLVFWDKFDRNVSCLPHKGSHCQGLPEKSFYKNYFQFLASPDALDVKVVTN